TAATAATTTGGVRGLDAVDPAGATRGVARSPAGDVVPVLAVDAARAADDDDVPGLLGVVRHDGQAALPALALPDLRTTLQPDGRAHRPARGRQARAAATTAGGSSPSSRTTTATAAGAAATAATASGATAPTAALSLREDGRKLKDLK